MGSIDLIVNGDDFGRSAGINRGILECFDHGLLTSASLMTVWPASAAAAAAALERPELSVGLHLDLGEWAFREDAWECTYLRVPLDDEAAIRAETERQLRVFRRLLDRDPSHLDSHQHVHRGEPARTILRELGDELGIPVRHESRVRYRGDFFGQSNLGEPQHMSLSIGAFISVLATLVPGVTELACHPGYADDLVTSYRDERAIEVETLCDDRVQRALDDLGIRLVSFLDTATPAGVRSPAATQSQPV